ncbi:MAG TPA: copper resistance protein CopC [Azonexus sp.]|nr:copper resistance protein CopC [Azonexus sp.]
MLRLITVAATLAFAAPALAQDPHGAHAGMQPASGHAGMDHSQHGQAAMDHSQHGQAAQSITTTPADGAMLMAAPAEFSITFPHAMSLSRVAVQAEGGRVIEVSVPETAPAQTISIPLPVLTPSTYSLSWTATGADGHEMSGTTEFMVH